MRDVPEVPADDVDEPDVLEPDVAEPDPLEPDPLEPDPLEPDPLEPEGDGAELLFSLFFDPDVAESLDLAADVSLDPPSLPVVVDDSEDEDFWPFASARESLR